MDGAGYPTEEELERIRKWPTASDADMVKLLEFIETTCWWEPGWGFRRRGRQYWLSTGGWSGNEEIIGAMQDNLLFWAFSWVSTRRGGHYRFHVPRFDKSQRVVGEKKAA